MKSIRSDVGDTWFVSMESEADAIATMLSIQKQQITFLVTPSALSFATMMHIEHIWWVRYVS